MRFRYRGPRLLAGRLAGRTAAVPAALLTFVLALAMPAGAQAAPQAGDAGITTVHLDATSLAGYRQIWSMPFGPGDNATQSFNNGVFTARDVPFKPGTDYGVLDHIKYLAVSNARFPVPATGTVSFSADVAATVTGAQAGHVVHGQYGPPGSFNPANKNARPYSRTLLKGQQASAALNLIDFCTGQLFDWFVSGDSAFTLTERLPSSVSGNLTNPDCPGASNVDLKTAYTQIIKEVPVAANRSHHVEITYQQAKTTAAVVFTLDGQIVSSVPQIGVPLDRLGLPYTGIYPSFGPGEPLGGKIHSFAVGHGLLSLVDESPFQFGCTQATASAAGTCDATGAPLSVSISPSERDFGQGAEGSFANFTVQTSQA
jgi:hypothetical protein